MKFSSRILQSTTSNSDHSKHPGNNEKKTIKFEVPSCFELRIKQQQVNMTQPHRTSQQKAADISIIILATS